ncbi:hypothetical protein [Brumicola nitratireducens]|uniref:Uncharacterized protein n=1 Tax=Glaciecola nitratireducens (strain JCM 12485 / KCTC 12276 / FR1064) TaxID=1085623 RepID=G4QKT7_GLANF|nr:hypothetical protein [Glaciecola nitratireducens]AEP30390.1 hypothetical protein GNIT_2289 [Glaciecola nitratireducens FR1064]
MSDNQLSDNQLSDNQLSDNQLSDNQLSDYQLSDYQKATLQIMGIPLYERRAGITLFDCLSLPSEPSVDSSAQRKDANSVLDTEQSAEHVAEESVTDRLVHSEQKEQQEEQKSPELIDEANDFIKQVLSVFAVSNTVELGLIWQVHDSKTISLKDKLLITPNAEALTTAASKKQLWNTLESHFKAQGWS